MKGSSIRRTRNRPDNRLVLYVDEGGQRTPSVAGGHRLDGDGPVVAAGNRFLDQLVVRAFSPASVQAYAFDLANFDRFLADVSLGLADVEPTHVIGYPEWQSGASRVAGNVVPLRPTRPEPSGATTDGPVT